MQAFSRQAPIQPKKAIMKMTTPGNQRRQLQDTQWQIFTFPTDCIKLFTFAGKILNLKGLATYLQFCTAISGRNWAHLDRYLLKREARRIVEKIRPSPIL
jgi:hypothetical protein